MKKKITALFLIIVILSGIFIISRHNTDKLREEKLILSEYQLEPYLNLRGWEVSEVNEETIKIPQTFNSKYKEFAEVMKKSGFDLASHKGEEVTRFTYNVLNYGESDIIAELILTSQNELISAALIEQKSDGFIKAI